MSQFFVGIATGTLPPTVPTSFVTDVNSPAIPAANVLNEVGGSTSVNNNNGIQTDGSRRGNTLTIQLTNRVTVTATTSDGGGQTQNVTLFTTTSNTVITYSGFFSGRDTTTGDATGGLIFGLGKNVTGTASIVGDNDALDESDASLVATDWDITASGATLSAQFVGVAGKTINWRCTFTYQQVS